MYIITMSLNKSGIHKNKGKKHFGMFQRERGRESGEALINIHLIMFACSLTLTAAMSNVDG